MKYFVHLIIFFLSTVLCSPINSQHLYQKKQFSFISYDKVPTWKGVVCDWDKQKARVDLFDIARYKGHGNYVCFGLKTGLKYPQFKNRVRHPENRIYLPILLYDLRANPIIINKKVHTWALRLEHYDYTDSKKSMELVMIRLMQEVSIYIKSEGGNPNGGIALLAGGEAKLPNKSISKAVEAAGYSVLSLYELLNKVNTLEQSTISSSKITKKIPVEVLNKGVAVGYLNYIDAGSEEKAKSNFNQILVYEQLPYRVPIANGILTLCPQTPFSHINLLAKNRGSLNLSISGQSARNLLKKFEGKLVKVSVQKDGVFNYLSCVPITKNNALAFWKTQQKEKLQLIKPNSSLTSFSHFKNGNIKIQDVSYIGAKAANYARLQRLLPDKVKPGFAVPFYYYESVLRQSGADKLIAVFLREKSLLSGALIKQRLKAIRTKIQSGELSEQFFKELSFICSKNYIGKRVRLRSSTNCEDLPFFNGAGLYISKGFQEGSSRSIIQKKVLSVYASLWSESAFFERDFFGIDHKQVSMGILINEAFKDEYANGVALTFPKENNGISIHINTQIGEMAVTNPEGKERPENIYFRHQDSKWYVTKTKSSIGNIFVEAPLLTPLVKELKNACVLIEKHFRTSAPTTGTFGVDIEFKIMKEMGVFKLYIKQARLLHLE
jgi:hypothetical protein